MSLLTCGETNPRSGGQLHTSSSMGTPHSCKEDLIQTSTSGVILFPSFVPLPPLFNQGTTTRLSSRFAGGRATACLVALWGSAARRAGDADIMAYVSSSRGVSSRTPATAPDSGLSLLRRNVLVVEEAFLRHGVRGAAALTQG